MEGMRSKRQLLLLWAALVIPAISAVTFEDQKNFFYHDPSTDTPPTGRFNLKSGNSFWFITLIQSKIFIFCSMYTDSYTPPATGGGGGHATPTPSHGGGSYGGTPPTNCGTPPSSGHHTSTPSTPTYHSPPRSNPIPPVTVTPPSITVPSPPTYDPQSPPYTCT